MCGTRTDPRAEQSAPVRHRLRARLYPQLDRRKILAQRTIFAGLQVYDDQKARIDNSSGYEVAYGCRAKDEKLTAEQRDAMLAGYQRMERSQVFKVLTTAAERGSQRVRAPAPPRARGAEEAVSAK